MQHLQEPFSHLFAATLEPTSLPHDDRFPDAGHAWSDAERKALVHAWASGRPLLVRGEAGCGKSQLARAAAAVLGVPLELEVIHPRYEASDLKYREDPVRRLTEAQMLAAVLPRDHGIKQLRQLIDQELAPERFVGQGPMWRAMVEAVPEERDTERWPRAVLLIDEIDKADADVPNALLDVLGQRSFQVPTTGETVRCDERQFPLVIITTNEDRELPPAFLRRCAVLNLKPAAELERTRGKEDAFVEWLRERALAHHDLKPLAQGDHPLLERAARQTWADRQAAEKDGMPTVGLAEYLDLLYSLLRLSDGDPVRALGLLDEISAFALVKHRDQDQQRAPFSPT